MDLETPETTTESAQTPQPHFIWYVGMFVLIVAGLFFMLFGVYLLIASYGLEDPAYFILTFFASNLMILISATLVIGFICRIVRAIRLKEQ